MPNRNKNGLEEGRTPGRVLGRRTMGSPVPKGGLNKKADRDSPEESSGGWKAEGRKSSLAPSRRLRRGCGNPGGKKTETGNS